MKIWGQFWPSNYPCNYLSFRSLQLTNQIWNKLSSIVLKYFYTIKARWFVYSKWTFFFCKVVRFWWWCQQVVRKDCNSEYGMLIMAKKSQCNTSTNWLTAFWESPEWLCLPECTVLHDNLQIEILTCMWRISKKKWRN